MGATHSQVLGSNLQPPHSHILTPNFSRSSSSPSLKGRCLQLLSAGSLGNGTHTPIPRFRFLDLPPEIRNMVYAELLVVGKVFYTATEHDLENGKRHDGCYSFRKPELPLLRVCKQIHAEAEPLYLSKNLFVLPVDWYQYMPYNRDHGLGIKPLERRSLFSIKGLDLVSNISFALDLKQLSHLPESHSALPGILGLKPEDFDRLDHSQRLNCIHDNAVDALCDKWIDVLDSLGRYRETGYDYVEVDFTHAICPIGCCRPFGIAVEDCVLNTSPRKLDVIGIYPREEREFTFIDLSESPPVHYTRKMLKEQFGLRFRQPGEPTEWDMWKGPPKVDHRLYLRQR